MINIYYLDSWGRTCTWIFHQSQSIASGAVDTILVVWVSTGCRENTCSFGSSMILPSAAHKLRKAAYLRWSCRSACCSRSGCPSGHLPRTPDTHHRCIVCSWQVARLNAQISTFCTQSYLGRLSCVTLWTSKCGHSSTYWIYVVHSHAWSLMSSDESAYAY